MDAVEKVSRAYRKDKERRVGQEAQPRNQFRLMPFRKFIQSKVQLGEVANVTDVVDSLMMVLPVTASVEEKNDAINNLAGNLLALSNDASLTVTCIATTGEEGLA